VRFVHWPRRLGVGLIADALMLASCGMQAAAVSKTANLVRESVSVSWTGMTPTRAVSGDEIYALDGATVDRASGCGGSTMPGWTSGATRAR
jgi:hypothetical protein